MSLFDPWSEILDFKSTVWNVSITCWHPCLFLKSLGINKQEKKMIWDHFFSVQNCSAERTKVFNCTVRIIILSEHLLWHFFIYFCLNPTETCDWPVTDWGRAWILFHPFHFTFCHKFNIFQTGQFYQFLSTI